MSQSHTHLEGDQQSPRFANYFNVQTVEEGLFKILKAYSAKQLSGADLMQMGNIWLNNFPPVRFFLYRSRTELALEKVQKIMQGVNSPAEFAQTGLFKEIMSDPGVVERFQKASTEIAPYPAYWPAEYKKEVGDEKQPAVKGWRAVLRNLLH